MLEHIEKIEPFCRRISELLEKNGIIIFSGPYDYPVHYDPIDNGFRPKVDDVVKLFPGFKILKSEIVTDFNYSFYLFNNYKLFLLTFLRVLIPFYKFKKWKKVVLPKFKYWNKNFKVTCIIIQKIN